MNYKISIPGINVTTIRQLNYVLDKSKPADPLSNLLVVPAGTDLTIYFNQDRPSVVVFSYKGHTKAVRIEDLRRTFKGHRFSKMPSLNKLEKMSNDGVCSTVTGKRVEPDGYGDDGSPSWLLVAGVI